MNKDLYRAMLRKGVCPSESRLRVKTGEAEVLERDNKELRKSLEASEEDCKRYEI